MALDFFATRTLLASVQQITPARSFLLDRYFPTNTASDVFSTQNVLVEYKKGTKKASPFVAPRKNGVAVFRDGYTMKEFTPSHIAPKRTLSIDELSKRGFGEALYSNYTPEQRQGVMIMNDLKELQEMNIRRKEEMAAQVMFTNACIMKEIVDDLGNYEEKEVRFYDEMTNPAIYTVTGGTPWTTTEASGKQIINDLANMIKMLTSKGLPATECIVAPNVADVLLNNEWLIKLMDNRRMEMGGINPEVLPSGASKIMRLNVKGRVLDILTYDEQYEDIDGNTKSYIPADWVCVTAPNAGRTIYGAITQLEQADGQFHTYAGIDVPKFTSDAVSNLREIMLSTAPLCMPNNANPFIVSDVL